MIAPNEFWLQLHRLAEAYEGEGRSEKERLAIIIAQFQEMPPVARRALSNDLTLLAASLADLCPLVVVPEKEPEARRANGGAA